MRQAKACLTISLPETGQTHHLSFGLAQGHGLLYAFANREVAERWPSGLRRSLGKRVYGKLYRGFESLLLRHFIQSSGTYSAGPLCLWTGRPLDNARQRGRPVPKGASRGES
jgi:hypothetical protein